MKKSLIKRINTKLQLQGKSILAETYGLDDKPYEGINLVASEEKKNFTIVAVGNFKNPNILTNGFTKEALSNLTKKNERDENGFSITISFEKDVLNENGFFKRITAGLSKSTLLMSEQMSSLFNKRKLDSAALNDLEDILIQADLGLEASEKVISSLSKEKFDKEVNEVSKAVTFSTIG